MIIRDSKLNDQFPRYEFKGTQAILKECLDGDEGTYEWMCTKCNVIKLFQLEVANEGINSEKINYN